MCDRLDLLNAPLQDAQAEEIEALTAAKVCSLCTFFGFWCRIWARLVTSLMRSSVLLDLQHVPRAQPVFDVPSYVATGRCLFEIACLCFCPPVGPEEAIAQRAIFANPPSGFTSLLLIIANPRVLCRIAWWLRGA